MTSANPPADPRAPDLLRVLFVTRKWPPAVGGMETYCVELVRELERRVELTTVSLPGRADGSPPHPLALARFLASQARALRRNAGRFDVVHFADLLLYALAPLRRRTDPGSAHVVSAHGLDIAFDLRDGLAPAVYGRYLRWMGAHRADMDAIIANSRATAAHCARVGLDGAEVVRLGVVVDGALPEPRRPGRYILFVGRLIRRKGLGWFAREVLPLLPEDLHVKVAGTVWDADEGAALELPRVEFLGPVFGDALRELRAGALATIMPNIPRDGREFEGFGLTAPEAARDGAVLVAAALDGIQDAVDDGVTGLLVAPGDAPAWADAIRRVDGWSDAERTAFLRQARARVEEYFTWARVADETVAIYRSAVASRQGAH